MHPRSTCPDSEETMKHPLVSERTAGSRTGQWKRLRDGRRNSLLVSDCENCELCRYINNDVWGKNPFVLAFASSYWRIGGWHRNRYHSVIALHLHAYLFWRTSSSLMLKVPALCAPLVAESGPNTYLLVSSIRLHQVIQYNF